MTKQMSNEASAHELVFGSVWPTERNCTSGISRANECAAAIIFCRCSALSGSFSHYQADVVQFACLCCLRCGRTARQKNCDGEPDHCEGQPGWDVVHNP